MPWDGLFNFGDDPVEVPANTSALSASLQDVMLTAVEKALPRMDVELPPGLMIGVDGDEDRLEPPSSELKAGAVVRGDRELALAWMLMFEGLKNPTSLCVAFRTEKQANLAKAKWRDGGRIKIISLARPKQPTFGGPGQSLIQRIGKPFLVAVSPSAKQLEEIRQLDTIEEKGEAKLCVVLINARIRGLSERDELREDLAAASNPILHARFVGEDGFLYKTLATPWVLSRRKPSASGGDPEMQEVWRGNDEPNEETLWQALR